MQIVLTIFDWWLCDFLVCTHFIFICHWLMLTFFCGKYSRISIVFWLLTDVDYFFMIYVIFLYWNIFMKCTHFIFICHWLMLTYFRVVNVPEFQYCFWLFTDVNYFSCANCSHHFSIDGYVISLYWNILMKCTHFIFICHWLMLTFFCGKYSRISIVFWLLTDVDYFSCAKCSYHSQLMSMWFSCTETYSWSAHTSSSFVIYWCWHIFVL